MISEDQAKDDAKERSTPLSELVIFLVTRGHTYAKANEIALDAMRGDETAINWLQALTEGEPL